MPGASTNTNASLTLARGPFPPQFSKLLPVLERALIDSFDPALEPMVAHVIVGPRICGKFDGGEKRDCAGQGYNGNVVDRRTKPEDRIGERGTLAVSKMLYFSSMG